MADVLREIFGLINKRYRDMGDGTHAEVVAIGDGDVNISASVSGGWDSYNNPDLDETAVQVKAGAGVIGDVHITNLTADVLYVKVWDALAADVTVGSDAPDWIWPVTTNGDENGSGFIRSWMPQGRTFETGLTIACVTEIGDAGSTGPAANGCVFDMTYK